MRPQLRACNEGLEAGVRRILIVGAAEENVLTRVLQNNESLGTAIYSE
jgi:acetylglutamate kinase